jgi:hypothetical protein
MNYYYFSSFFFIIIYFLNSYFGALDEDFSVTVFKNELSLVTSFRNLFVADNLLKKDSIK